LIWTNTLLAYLENSTFISFIALAQVPSLTFQWRAVKSFTIVNYASVGRVTYDCNLRLHFTIQKFVTFNCKIFITLGTVITIVTYDRKTFKVLATGPTFQKNLFQTRFEATSGVQAEVLLQRRVSPPGVSPIQLLFSLSLSFREREATVLFRGNL
jgi:hypothetical protein